MKLTIEELQDLNYAISDVIGYLTDNSCSNPECCGGPFYDIEDFGEGLSVLKKYNLEVDE